MIQEVFRVGLLHREPVVLRRRLLPLSLGHLYILMAAESPYFYGGKHQLGDLAFGVYVCSRSWRQNLAEMGTDVQTRRIVRWGRRCRKMDHAAEHARFVEYLNENCAFPERWSDPKKPARRCKHPWPLLAAVSIMPLVGEDRAWDMPVSLANSYSSALAERGGDDTLRSEFEDDLAAGKYSKGASNG